MKDFNHKLLQSNYNYINEIFQYEVLYYDRSDGISSARLLKHDLSFLEGFFLNSSRIAFLRLFMVVIFLLFNRDFKYPIENNHMGRRLGNWGSTAKVSRTLFY